MARDLSGDPPGRVNTTDPESALVKTPRGFIQGYNAHVAATEGGIVIAAEVTNVNRDQGMLVPMVAATRAQLAAAASRDTPRVVVADAGYCVNRDIVGLGAEGLTVLVPPDAHTRTIPLPGRTGGVYEQMRRALASPSGRRLYRRRQAIVEPVFGDTKFNRRTDRFRRRGLAACRAEWRLICATHNLLKLWRAAPALP